jgi:alkylated DNA repair dioxygenase AlkB
VKKNSYAKGITENISHIKGYRVHKYKIPGIKGFVAHLVANKTIVKGPGGADDMFEELQTKEIGLRRRPINVGFTRHFAVNYGMPYKYVAATNSLPFAGSANAIRDARSRLNWAAKTILSQEGEEWHEWKEFNEVLVLSYMEKQKINYHDDGETGLGDTIATFSLGEPGTMRLRMKAKDFCGLKKDGKYNDETPPIPLCKKYLERLAANAELAALSPSDAMAKKKKLPKELGLKRANAKVAIQLELSHGDIVIMCGAEIQKHYEHSVQHKGMLRMALTCRHIELESLKEKDKPQYEVEPDDGAYDGSLVDMGETQMGETQMGAMQMGERTYDDPSNPYFLPASMNKKFRRTAKYVPDTAIASATQSAETDNSGSGNATLDTDQEAAETDAERAQMQEFETILAGVISRAQSSESDGTTMEEYMAQMLGRGSGGSN